MLKDCALGSDLKIDKQKNDVDYHVMRAEKDTVFFSGRETIATAVVLLEPIPFLIH